MYKIPLFELNYDENEEKAVLDVLRSKWISSGPKCMELEKYMMDMFHVEYALTVTNCTAALHLALCGLDIKPGDEVIVPSLTFVATVNAVRYIGAKPVFCDIESCERPVIDPEKMETLITDKTKAVIVMHYAGFSCEMDSIMDLARRYNLKVVEDACHGPLSEYKGKKLGTIGDVGCFSFFSNKNIATGEGGAIVTNEKVIFDKIKLLRSHGMTATSYEKSTGHAVNYDVIELGYNYRFDDIRASLGIEQLKKLSKDIEAREVIRSYYINNLKNLDVIIPFANYNELSSSYIFSVVLRDKGQKGSRNRDFIRKYLKDCGIQTSVHYPAVHRFKIYEKYNSSLLPVTEFFSDNEFTLPMYGSLSESNIEYICESIKNALAE